MTRLVPQTSRAFCSSCRVLASSSSKAAPKKAATPPAKKTSWQPALEAGKVPAYDESIKFLRADSEAKKAQLEAQKGQLDAAERERLEVQSEVNEPEVRWNFRHGKADYSKPVYRAIHEAEWRKEGRLATLMDRIDRSKVVPDVLGSIDPTVDLHLQLVLDDATLKTIKPDSMLLPEQTLKAPQVTPRILHGETKLYTLAIVDPDVPNAETGRFESYCHQLITNMSLSAAQTGPITESSGDTILAYVPPHPSKGSKNHRYVTVLLEQSDRVSGLEQHVQTNLPFDLRALATQHSMTPVGVHFFRSKWSPVVSTIYADILKQEEPTFGKSPRVDLYKIFGAGNKYLGARRESS